MSYTATTIEELDVSKPTEGATLPSEVNDAIREIKTALKNQYGVASTSIALSLLATHGFVMADTTSASFAISLPAAASVASASYTKVYVVQKVVDDNVLTILPSGAETINGEASLTLNDAFNSLILWTNGSNWFASYILGEEPVAPLTPYAVPAGVIQMWGGTVAPTGYFLCDGTAYNRTTYADLFAAIGTNYGVGDNSTTFNVPDLRGRAPVGVGTGTGGGSSGTTNSSPTGGTALTAKAIGDWGGEETHTLTTPESAAHTHDTTIAAVTSSMYNTPFYSENNGVILTLRSPAAVTSTSVGGGSAHNNMQPTMAINFIIKH